MESWIVDLLFVGAGLIGLLALSLFRLRFWQYWRNRSPLSIQALTWAMSIGVTIAFAFGAGRVRWYELFAAAFGSLVVWAWLFYASLGATALGVARDRLVERAQQSGR